MPAINLILVKFLTKLMTNTLLGQFLKATVRLVDTILGLWENPLAVVTPEKFIWKNCNRQKNRVYRIHS
jgi:hypothetical protein